MGKTNMSRLDQLEHQSLEILKKALSMAKNPLLAYSGGKDSIVVCHMSEKLGVRKAVCETSFYFHKALESVLQIGQELKLDVTYKNSLDINWLKKNKTIIFSADTKKRSWSFAARQQRTVKKYAKHIKADLVIYGRRTEENHVKKHIYETKDGLNCHPIRDWKEADVWAYFKKYGITIPYIYSTTFGKIEGNAPFYTLNSKHCGGVEKAWEIVSQMDNRYHKGMLND